MRRTSGPWHVSCTARPTATLPTRRWTTPPTSGRTTSSRLATDRLSAPHRPPGAGWALHPSLTLGEPVRGLGGRDRVGAGELEHCLGGVVDLRSALLGAVEAEALELVGHLDQ